MSSDGSRDVNRETSAVKDYTMDAEANARRLINEADAYLGPVDMSSPNIQEIVEWLKKCRPMDMCSSGFFLSMLRLGVIPSLHFIKSLLPYSKEVVDAVLRSQMLTTLGITDPEIISMFKKYLKLYTKKKQSDMKPALIQDAKKYDDEMNRRRTAFERESNITKAVQDIEVISEPETHKMTELGFSLDNVCTNGEREALERMVDQMLLDIKSMGLNTLAVWMNRNAEQRLDYTAPTVIGPYYYNYGSAEVVLVLKPEIMFHPDYYDTPISAIMYSLGLDGNKNFGSRWNVKHQIDRTPWHANEGDWGHGGREDFFQSKMHRTAPSYYEALTKEWLCRVKSLYGIEPDKATLGDVKEAWNGYGSEYVTEGHLPESTPIEYVEAVIIQRKAYDQAIQDALGKAFLDKHKATGSLRIVDTPVEANEETGRYIDTTHLDPVGYPTGFCFASNSKYERFIPSALNNTSNIVRISFMAHGAPFCVALSNVKDFKGSDDNPRKALTFRIGSISGSGDCECLSATSFNSTPHRCGSSLSYQCAKDFNAGCPLGAFINYAITIDYAAGKATLAHWGPSSVHNKSVVEVELEGGVRYSYISFISLPGGERKTVIRNVSEDKTPRPTM